MTNDPLSFIDEKPSEGPEANTTDVVTSETPLATGERARDEHGRFATSPTPAAPTEPVKTEAVITPPVVPPAPETAVKPAESHTVPLAKYLDSYNEARELRRENQRLKQQFQAQTAPAPQLPDPLQDPDGYRQALLDEAKKSFEPQIRNTRLEISEQMARQQFGDEKVNAAFTALEQANDPFSHQRIMNSPHPWGELVKWHQQKQLIDSIGNDPDAWATRRAAELAAASQQQAAPGLSPQQQAAPVIPAASISRAPAGAKPGDVPVGPGQSFDATFAR